MSCLQWLLAYLFDCVHPHTTWPHRNRAGLAYVVCVDCGRELPYSLENMRIITREDRTRKPWDIGRAVAASLMLVSIIVFFGCTRAAGRTRDSLGPAQLVAPSRTPTLVIGFVGGFVHSDDLRHSEVQLARYLRDRRGDRLQVEVFKNRQRERAHQAIVEWVNGLGPGVDEQPRQPQIILFGHSWGASAVIYLARQLERDGIPVALTVQVDSVQKHGQDDSVVPANVAQAVNFYQTKGIIHGRTKITAADPSHTSILGNWRLEYRHEPANCHTYPWYDRLFFKGHTSIECDPQVWSEVRRLIETHLNPTTLEPVETKVASELAHSVHSQPLFTIRPSKDVEPAFDSLDWDSHY